MHDHHRREIGTRILVAETDQRIDIAEAGILRSRRQPLEHGTRAIARLDHDIEPFGTEIAFVLRRQERRRQRIETAVQRKANGGVSLGASHPAPGETGGQAPHRQLSEPAPTRH